jgi:hypothetical protein
MCRCAHAFPEAIDCLPTAFLTVVPEIFRILLGPMDLGPLAAPELTDAQSLCLHLAFRVGALGAETPVNLA